MAYFQGTALPTHFPLKPRGTPFQQRVWQLLQTIPFGETRSYGAIAHALGIPGGARAVGMANRCNPIPLFIPCHRVVGHKGQLTGFAAGLQWKQALLHLEQTVACNASL
jgi:methylated-DNA-[protein]-cysteine S-methyltransferase